MLSLLSPLAITFLAPAGSVAVAPTLAGFGATVAATPAPAGAVVVTNAIELQNALKNPKAGATILLAPGKYGTLSLYSRIFTGGVTLASQSASNQAQFDDVKLNNVSNLQLRQLKIGRALRAGEPNYTKLVEVINSRTIVLDTSTVAGSTDGNPANDATGMLVSNSDDVVIRYSKFNETFVGINVSNSRNVKVLGNQLRTMKTDGIVVGTTDNVQVEDNLITDIRWTDPDHPDGIQMFSKGRPMSDILIRGNVVLQGAGRGSQGIFLNTSVGAEFQRVTIDNNLVYGNAWYNGIYVKNAIGLTLTNNNALSPTNDTKSFWIRLEAIRGATVANNVADRFVLDTDGVKSTSVRLTGNLFLNEKPSFASRIIDINRVISAAAANLTLANVGFLSQGGSNIAATEVGQESTATGSAVAQADAPVSAPTNAPAILTPTAAVVDAPTSAPTFAKPAATPAITPVAPKLSRQQQLLQKLRSASREQ